eukprot:472787-Ditylum_brightwellii.AAC.1
MDRNTQDATGNTVLCPVRAAAALVQRIQKMPGTDLETPICTVLNDGKLKHITQKMLLNEFRSATK